jgi:hypothetical protein
MRLVLCLISEPETATYQPVIFDRLVELRAKRVHARNDDSPLIVCGCFGCFNLHRHDLSLEQRQ